jgi:uncharacterized protein
MTDPAEVLRSAVQRADTEAVRALLTPSNSLIDVPDEQFGNTALHWAVTGGYTEIVVLLLEASADPNIPNENGLAPLYLARDFGLGEIAELLSRFGAHDVGSVS